MCELPLAAPRVVRLSLPCRGAGAHTRGACKGSSRAIDGESRIGCFFPIGCNHLYLTAYQLPNELLEVIRHEDPRGEDCRAVGDNP